MVIFCHKSWQISLRWNRWNDQKKSDTSKSQTSNTNQILSTEAVYTYCKEEIESVNFFMIFKKLCRAQENFYKDMQQLAQCLEQGRFIILSQIRLEY